MISYTEGKWSLGFAFQFYGTVMDRALAISLPCALLTIALHFAFHQFPEVADTLRNDLDANTHQGFTFMLGFLIVFRTQQGYSRWWEAGTLLQQLRGDWFNSFSNLLAFLNLDADDPEQLAKVEEFKHCFLRLYSLLYGNAICQVSTKSSLTLQYIDCQSFDISSMQVLGETHDTCELVLQWLQRLIVEANTKKIIKIAPPILTRVYNQLGQGMVKLNNARKIKEFPVPFVLAQLIAVMLILHWFVTVWVCALMLDNPWSSFLAAFIVSFSFWGVNYIAVELENPYGDDANDLPLCEMQEDMNASLLSLMHPKACRPPMFDFDADRDTDFASVLVQKPVGAVVTRMHTGASGAGSEGASSQRLATIVARASRTRQDVDSKEEPLVDDCQQGQCVDGRATVGSACDSSYRDSVLASPWGTPNALAPPPQMFRKEARASTSPPQNPQTFRKEAKASTLPSPSQAIAKGTPPSTPLGYSTMPDEGQTLKSGSPVHACASTSAPLQAMSNGQLGSAAPQATHNGQAVAPRADDGRNVRCLSGRSFSDVPTCVGGLHSSSARGSATAPSNSRGLLRDLTGVLCSFRAGDGAGANR